MENINQSINQVVSTKFGTPATGLEIRSTNQVCTIKPSQVLLKVISVSLNPADLSLIKGDFRFFPGSPQPPFVIGLDGYGEVLKVGQEVDDFKVGDKVIFLRPSLKAGALSQIGVFEKNWLAKINSQNLSQNLDIGSCPLTASTALQALQDLAKLQPGQTVIINGASGGVGIFAVQIAKILGAKVVAVASEAKKEAIMALGANLFWDYKNGDICKSGFKVDVFFDTSNTIKYIKARPLLKPMGRYVSVNPGQVLGAFNPVFKLMKMPTDYGIIVSPKDKTLKQIVTWIEAGKLKMVVDRKYTLQQTVEAFDYLSNRTGVGKVLIVL